MSFNRIQELLEEISKSVGILNLRLETREVETINKTYHWTGTIPASGNKDFSFKLDQPFTVNWIGVSGSAGDDSVTFTAKLQGNSILDEIIANKAGASTNDADANTQKIFVRQGNPLEIWLNKEFEANSDITFTVANSHASSTYNANVFVNVSQKLRKKTLNLKELKK